MSNGTQSTSRTGKGGSGSEILLDRSSSHTASAARGVPESAKGRQRWRGPRHLCGLREAGTPEHKRAPRKAKVQDVSRATAAQGLHSKRGREGPEANFDSRPGGQDCAEGNG